MPRTFGIVTTCMSRLDHLKVSLPAMLRQDCSQVIVVDYSCPQKAGDYVRRHFPGARVVRVQGQQAFSNWKARNAGAASIDCDLLLFCDADVILREGAVAAIAETLPDDTFGFFKGRVPTHLKKQDTKLANNQLKGFQAIPRAAFVTVGGYDEVLQGYASGADTDLQSRLKLAGLKPVFLDPGIVEDVLEHSDADRISNHADPAGISYGAGMLYRAAKFAMLRMTGELEASMDTRLRLYAGACAAARKLPAQKSTAISVAFDHEPVRMPRLIGFDSAIRRVSVKVELVGGDKSPKPK